MDCLRSLTKASPAVTILATALAAAYAGQAVPAAAADPMADLLATTVKLTNGKKSHSTGWLVKKPGGLLFLISAGHAFKGAGADALRMTYRAAKPDGSFERQEMAIKIQSADGKPVWQAHAEMDVAAMPIDLPPGTAIRPLPIERLANDVAIQNGALRPADDVYVACYPVGTESSAAGFAVLRRGTVASFPLAPVARYKTYFVDVSTFGGDSGAPVAVVRRGSESDYRIVGVVVAKQMEDNKTITPYEERTTHFSLGLAVVVPAEFVLQTLAKFGN